MIVFVIEMCYKMQPLVLTLPNCKLILNTSWLVMHVLVASRDSRCESPCISYHDEAKSLLSYFQLVYLLPLVYVHTVDTQASALFFECCC